MFRQYKSILIVTGCALLILGCNRSSTISTPGGDVKVTKKDGGDVNLKITTKDGQTIEQTVSKKADLSALGVPIYPGASEKEGASMSMKDSSNKSVQSVTLLSSDALDKVAAFYKDQFKGKKVNEMTMNMGKGKMTHIMYEEKSESVAVVLTEQDGKTNIFITKTTK